jgi:HSP20 family molecular chaperone IbpA
MKKKNPVDELIRIMEEAIREMREGGKLIFIDVSINLCQNMCNIPPEIFVQKKINTSVDILETEKNIHAVVGLPGLEKKDIVISCNGWNLEIKARNVEKIETFETIELPAKVIKTGMKATYQNGILEVVFNKSKKRVSKKE